MTRERAQELRGLAAIVAVAALAHAKLVLSPYLSWGDIQTELVQPALRDPASLRNLFSPAYFSVFWHMEYRPLAALLLVGYRSFAGPDPLLFRIAVFMLKVASACLVWRVARPKMGRWALAAGCLYAFHPFCMEFQMRELSLHLAAFFSLSAAAVHQRWRGRYDAAGLSLLGGLFALDLLATPTGLLLPLLLACAEAVEPPLRGGGGRRGLGPPVLVMGLVAAGYLGLLASRIGMPWAVPAPTWALRDSVALLTVRLASYAHFMMEFTAADIGGPGLALLAALLAWSAWRAGPRAAAAYGGWLAAALLPWIAWRSLFPGSGAGVDLSPEPEHLAVAGAGYCWLLAWALRGAWEQRRWTSSLVPTALALALLHQAYGPYFDKGLEVDLSCLKKPALTSKERACIKPLVVLLASLPRLRAHAPGLYESSRRTLWGNLGPATPALEAHFDGLFDDSCRSAYFIRADGASSYDGFWRLLSGDRSFQEGLRQARLGRSGEAVADYGRALALDPAHREAYAARAVALWAQGDVKGALRDHRRAGDISWTEPRLQSRWWDCRIPGGEASAEMADRLKRAGEAKRDAVSAFTPASAKKTLRGLSAAVRLDPLDAEAWLSRGVVKEALLDRSGALSDIDEALALEEQRSAWEASAGQTHLLLSESNPAYLKGAILTSRAELWVELDRKDRAREDLRRALREAPPGWAGRDDARRRLEGLEGPS